MAGYGIILFVCPIHMRVMFVTTVDNVFRPSDCRQSISTVRIVAKVTGNLIGLPNIYMHLVQTISKLLYEIQRLTLNFFFLKAIFYIHINY